MRSVAVQVLLLGLAIGSPSHPSRGASTDPEPKLLAAVIRGMEARETLVHHQMHSLKGLWIVEEEDHTARPVRAVSTGSADANNRGPGSTSVVPGKRLPESHSRVYVAVSGERYRQSVR